jgi:hypothetical protein
MTKTNPGEVPCNGCTLCCRGWHLVVLFPEFGDDVASYETTDFNGRPALKFKENGDCHYLGDTGCTIHDRVPGVCREFDCRAIVFTSTRHERQGMIKDGHESRDVFKAGRERVHTLNTSHPLIIDLLNRAKRGESYMSRVGALKPLKT